MQFFLFLALIFALALVLFAVQNSIIVTLTFIKWTFEGSLSLVLVSAFAAGMVTGAILFIPTLWRKAKNSRSYKKRIKELEGELLSYVGQSDTSGEEQIEE